MGRKLNRLNRKLISDICLLAESETLTLSEAAARFEIGSTVYTWYHIGKSHADVPKVYRTSHERLCVELFNKYRAIQESQERALINYIQQSPECGEVALLVRVLQPELQLLKSHQRLSVAIE